MGTSGKQVEASSSEFLIESAMALYSIALGLACKSAEPEAWAMGALSIALEKAAHDVRRKWSPTEYGNLRASIAANAERMRAVSDGQPLQHEGAAVIAAVLSVAPISDEISEPGSSHR